MKTALKLSALTLCLSLAGCLDKTAEEHFSNAQQAIKINDNNKAIIELKNAITKSPEAAKYRQLLGELSFNQGSFASAEKELEKAKTLGIQSNDLINQLVQAHFFNNTYAAVIKLNTQHPTDTTQYYSALVDIQDNKVEQAKQTLQQLTKSTSVFSHLAKAQLNILSDELSSAFQLATKAVKENPNNLAALLLQGNLGLKIKQPEISIDAFNQVAQAYENYFPFQLYLALAYAENNEFEKAQPLVSNLMKSRPNSSFLNQLQGQIDFSKSDFDNAKLHAEKAIQGNIDNTFNRLIAGYSSYQLKKYEQAYEHLKTIEKQIPNEHIAKRILVDLQLKLGYENDALDSLNNLDNPSSTDVSLFTQASNYLLESGDKQAAESMLESAINLETDNPTEVAKQGILQLQLNQIPQGLDTLKKALEIKPNLELAKIGLAAAYMAKQDYIAALELAKEWQDSSEQQVVAQGWLLQSSVETNQNNHSAAKKSLKNALEAAPDNMTAMYRLGAYAFNEKDYENAYKYFTNTLDQSSNHTGSMRALLVLTKQQPQYVEKVENFFTNKTNIKKAEATSQLSLIYLYGAHKQYDKALNLINQIKTSNSDIKGIDILSGDIYLKQKQLDKAIGAYRSVYQLNPQSSRVEQKLLRVYEISGRHQDALNLIRNKLDTQPNNENLQLLQAYYNSLAGSQINNSELNRLKQIPNIEQSWVYHKTLANLAWGQKKMQDASLHYKKAYELNPSEQNIIQWSRAEAIANSVESTIKVLESYPNLKSSHAVSLYLANAYLNVQQSQNAYQLYQEINQSFSKNALVLNNLAFLALKLKRNNEALNYAKQAHKMAPENPAVLDTYATALAANNQTEKSLAIYDKALQYSPGNAEISINKAKTLISLKRMDLVEQTLNSIDNPNNQEIETIKRLRQKL